MEIVITVLCIAACVLLFSFAIFIHEFGHFLAARKLGMKVDAFSIGFGPALWKWRRDGVEYRISLIPFGGYVALPDLDPAGTAALEGGMEKEDGEEREDPAPTVPVTPMKKIIVAFCGPLGNIVLAVALAFLLAAAPGAHFGELPAEIGRVLPDGPAATAGMAAGDRVLAVDGHPVATWSEMQTEVQLSGGRAVDFLVRRGGADVSLTLVPDREPASGAYFIKALSVTNSARAVAWMPDRNPFRQLEWDVTSIVRVLKALGTPKEAKSAAKALGGPVMIAEGLYRQVRHNGYDALGFLRFLCVNLAVINLLPIPVLDGGLIFFALIELCARRKVPRRLVDWTSRFFMFLLLGLMLFLVWRDITRSVRIHRAVAAAEAGADASEKEAK